MEETQRAEVTWTTRTAEIALSAGFGLLLAVGVFVVADAPGRLLVSGGAVLLLGQALRDLVQRPRLSAGRDGVHVRRIGGGVHLPWPGLQVRVRDVRRLGLRSRTLELDGPTGPGQENVLVVLGRRDLGADPEEVVRRLRDLDPTTS